MKKTRTYHFVYFWQANGLTGWGSIHVDVIGKVTGVVLDEITAVVKHKNGWADGEIVFTNWLPLG